MQASINLLDEEYKRELRNAATRSKNEEVSKGIIEEIEKYNSEDSTLSYGGASTKLVNDFMKEFQRESYKSRKWGDKIDQMWEYLDPEGFANRSIWKKGGTFPHLQEIIEQDPDKFANSLTDKNNPMYQLFSSEAIDSMLENATEYFREAERIKNERDLFYQEFASQINLNIQAEDAYSGLSTNAKAFVNEYVNSLDYAKIQTTDDFLAMADDAKKFVEGLSNNTDIQQKINELYALSASDMPIDDYISDYSDLLSSIQKYCDNNGIELPIDIASDFNDLKTKYDSIISQFSKKEKDVLSDFFEEHSINTLEEFNYWESVTKGASTAQQAIERYNSSLVKVKETIDGFDEKFSENRENSLDPALETIETIKSAMQTLSNGELLEWSEASELMFDIDTDGVLANFEEIDGKYRLIGNDISTLIKLKDAEVLKQKEVIQGLVDEQRQAMEVLKANLALAKSKLSRSNSESDAAYYRQQIQDIESEIKQVYSNIKDCDIIINHLNSRLGDTVDYTEALENQVEKIQEESDKYANAMLAQIDNIIEGHESEKDVLDREKEALEEQMDILEEQQDAIEEIIDNYKTVADIVESVAEKEIDLLKEQQEAEEAAIQAKIDALKEAHEQQEEENSLIEKELTLQQKLRDLEKAKQTKVRTYSEARGWHYGTDKEAIVNAQTAVDEAQSDYDKAVADKKYNDQLDALEKEKELIAENYEDQIKAYEDYYKQWKSIVDEQEEAENEQLAQQILGVEWREKIKNKDTEILNKFSSNFRGYNSQLNQLINNEIANLKLSIKAKEDETKAKEKQIQSWKDYKTQVEKSINDIKGKYDEYLSHLGAAQLTESSTYEERANALENFVNKYQDFANRINYLQSQMPNLDLTLNTNLDEVRWKTAEFLTQYRDGVLAMQEALANSATGFGIVNSQWDADLVNAANYARSIDFYGMMGFASGGTADSTGLAMLHGTKQKAETIFNAEQSKRLYDMVKTDSFSNLVAQRAVDGITRALGSNQTINNSSNVGSTIHIHEMVIKADNPTQFHDQFIREIGQYWKIKLAENRVK